MERLRIRSRERGGGTARRPGPRPPRRAPRPIPVDRASRGDGWRRPSARSPLATMINEVRSGKGLLSGNPRSFRANGQSGTCRRVRRSYGPRSTVTEADHLVRAVAERLVARTATAAERDAVPDLVGRAVGGLDRGCRRAARAGPHRRNHGQIDTARIPATSDSCICRCRVCDPSRTGRKSDHAFQVWPRGGIPPSSPPTARPPGSGTASRYAGKAVRAISRLETARARWSASVSAAERWCEPRRARQPFRSEKLLGFRQFGLPRNGPR